MAQTVVRAALAVQVEVDQGPNLVAAERRARVTRAVFPVHHVAVAVVARAALVAQERMVELRGLAWSAT